MEVLEKIDMVTPEQVIAVPTISLERIPQRSVCRRPRRAEHLVEVPTIVSVSSLRGPVEQNEDIPVPHGRGGLVGRRGLQGLRSGQNSTAFGRADHVDVPVPRSGRF